MIDRVLCAVVELLFPQRCVFCGEVSGSTERCCPRCEQRLRLPPEPKVAAGLQIYSCFRYHGGGRAIAEFKFRGKREYAEYFAEQMSNLILRQGLVSAFDVVTFPPMPEGRKRGRGYNQAELLAAAIARRLGLPCDGCGLYRLNAFAQHDLHLAMRRKQLASGFGIAPGTVTAPNVLLVDDLCTSGGTLCSCAGLLRSAGAKRVIAITFCRAE